MLHLAQHTAATRRRRRLVVPAAALALALGVAACGDDDDEDASATTTTEEQTTTTAADAAEGETVDITAVNYGFQGVPESVDSGTTFSLTNQSEDEVHEMILLRIDDDETRPLEELIGLSDEEAGEITEVQGVSVALPGEEGMVVEGDLTLEQPGRYAMVCFIPVGADPQIYRDLFASPTPPEGPPEIEGPPHVTEGMYAEFAVQ